MSRPKKTLQIFKGGKKVEDKAKSGSLATDRFSTK
jgi:hypothetical protein